MRIVICTNAYPPDFMGGAELMAHEQAKALVQMGHDVRVYAGELTSNRPRYTSLEDMYDGLHIRRISLVEEDFSPEYLNFHHSKVEKDFAKFVKRYKPDIVHFHNIMGLSVLLPAIAKKWGARTVGTLHDFWAFCLRNTAVLPDGSLCHDTKGCAACIERIHDGRNLYVPLRARKDFMRYALSYVDHFIAPSHYIAKRYQAEGWALESISVIPNGVDLERFVPAGNKNPKSNVSLAFIGHLAPHKGPELLLAALSHLQGNGVLEKHSINLLIVGDGPQRQELEATVFATGLASHVQFCGKVANAEMPRIYQQCGIVILPSVWPENQPVCIMEAMAMALPVIASDLGGIPELVDNEQTGLVFRLADAKDLADKIVKLV